MGLKARQVATDSPKAEVGEIDTRAPFASVRAALSLFGAVAGAGSVSAEKSSPRKPKSESAEKLLAEESQLHIAHKELHKFKEQLRNAESTRIQALAELDSAKKTVEVLTHELNTIKESKELALEVTETAKGQTKLSKELEAELDSAREHYAAAITELDAAKQELRRIRKDFDASMDAKISAFHQEVEAKQLARVNAEKATHLSKEIEEVKESVFQVKIAIEQAQQEESKIRYENDTAQQSYMQAFEESEKKRASLAKEIDPELSKNLEAKLAEVEAIQRELELQRVTEEENSLKSLVESLKLELAAVEKELSELKEKDGNVESGAAELQTQLKALKSELEEAVATEANASSASGDLASTLLQLSAESEAALLEAEGMKKNADELRLEAEAARTALAESETKLQTALIDAEEAKAAEARALDQIKEISERASACRSPTSEHGARISISTEEFESLRRKVEESEKLSEIKVAAAMTQVEAVRSSENEAVKRMEAVCKEMEETMAAIEEAVKRAEMAEGAKKALEGELARLREKEQKETVVAQCVAEARVVPKEQSSPPRVPAKDSAEKGEGQKKVSRSSSRTSTTKRTLLPSLSSLFRRKSVVDGGSPA